MFRLAVWDGGGGGAGRLNGLAISDARRFAAVTESIRKN